MRRNWLLCVAVSAVSFGAVNPAMAEVEWRAVPEDERTMTSEPKAPGAPAVILYMRRERDDQLRKEFFYSQIKILTDEGRRFADLQIPYDRNRESIEGFEARSIRKDGTIVPYTGKVFEKPIVSGTSRKVFAKTIAIPDAEVGSVVEYRFTRIRGDGLRNEQWLLENQLFTREAHYSFRGNFPLRYSSPYGLPAGSEGPRTEGKHILLDTRDVPAYVAEEFSPPEAENQHRVDIVYAWDGSTSKPTGDPDKFWKTYSKEAYGNTKGFLSGSHSLAPIVAGLLAAGDTPEAKLRKLYAATLKVRNKSYEPSRSGEEEKRGEEYSAINVRELWKKQYGWSWQINLLFLAFAQEAGFQAEDVLLADRGEVFFDPLQMNPSPLDWRVVAVTLDGKERYFNPGNRFLPFGMLSWGSTATKALKLGPGGGVWIDMPKLHPEDSRVERVASFTLTSKGELQGKVTETFTGAEALWRRARENNEDVQHRKKFLEDDLGESLKNSYVARLTNNPDWDGSESPLVAEFELKVQDRLVRAGNRVLLPAGMFVVNQNSAFKGTERNHSLYFPYPYETHEDVKIELPPGWTITATPSPRAADMRQIAYGLDVDAEGAVVRIKRKFKLDLLLLKPDRYELLRKFYQDMRTGDDQQIVLTAAPATGAQPK